MDGGRVSEGTGEVGDALIHDAGGIANGSESSVIITVAQYAPLFRDVSNCHVILKW